MDYVNPADYYYNKWRDSLDEINVLKEALRDLSDGWECCPLSQAMRRVARKALEKKDD